MAVTSKWYSSMLTFHLGAVASNNVIDYLSTTIKVVLTTSSNSISQTADQSFSHLTNEVSGTGYTAGGATLGTKTLATSTLTTTFDAADTTWTTVSVTAAAQAHVYALPAGGNTPLMCYQDFGGSQTVGAADLYIIWHASGLGNFVVA